MRSLLLALALALPLLPALPAGGPAFANDGSGDGGAGSGSGGSGEGSGAGSGAGDASGADGNWEPDCTLTNSCASVADPLALPPDVQIRPDAFGSYCGNFPAACTDDGIPGDLRYYCLWHPDQCVRPEAQQPTEPAPVPPGEPAPASIPAFAPAVAGAAPCAPRPGGATTIGARVDSTSVPGWGGCRR